MEAALSSRYGASRTALEQTLRRLVDDGLLRRHAGRRLAFVDTLTDPGSIRASYDLRLMVEPGLFRLQGYSPDATAIRSLQARHRDLLASLDRGRGADAFGNLPQRTAIVALDADFHLALASFAKNPFAVTVLKQQLDLRRLLEFGMNEDSAQVALWCREHLAILKEVLADRRDKAALLLEAHLVRAARDALNALNMTCGPRTAERDAPLAGIERPQTRRGRRDVARSVQSRSQL